MAFAAERQLPAITGSSGLVRQGLLMSYSVDLPAIGRRAAAYVDHILKGARPTDLPVERASEFGLRINLKAANALGLALVAGTDDVIE